MSCFFLLLRIIRAKLTQVDFWLVVTRLNAVRDEQADSEASTAAAAAAAAEPAAASTSAPADSTEASSSASTSGSSGSSVQTVHAGASAAAAAGSELDGPQAGAAGAGGAGSSTGAGTGTATKGGTSQQEDHLSSDSLPKFNRVDTTLNDVFALLSLFFLTIGRSRETPAAFSQLGCMKVSETFPNSLIVVADSFIWPHSKCSTISPNRASTLKAT